MGGCGGAGHVTAEKGSELLERAPRVPQLYLRPWFSVWIHNSLTPDAITESAKDPP